MPLDLHALKTPARDRNKLITFLQQQEFQRLLVRIGAAGQSGVEADHKDGLGSAVRSMASSPATNNVLSSGPATNILAQNEKAASSDTSGQTGSAAQVEARYQLITEAEDLRTFLATVREQGFLVVDTETTSLNAAAADLVGIAMALAPACAASSLACSA